LARGARARCPWGLLMARWRHHRRAHDDGRRDAGLLHRAPPPRRGRPLPDDQPPSRQMRPDGRVDPVHQRPGAPPPPHAAGRATLTHLGKEPRARQAAVCPQRPAHLSRAGRLELLAKGQRRHTEASFGPGRGDHGPANRERAPGYDSPCQPAFPRPAARGVQRPDHRLVSRQHGQRHTDESRAPEALSEGRPTPPAPPPPQTRPTSTGVLGG